MGDKLFPLPARDVVPSGKAVVAAVVKALDDIPIPPRHKQIIGRHAKELLAEGFEFEIVVVAAVTALRRGTPQHMQFVASDIVMALADKRMSRKEYERMIEEQMILAKRRERD